MKNNRYLGVLACFVLFAGASPAWAERPSIWWSVFLEVNPAQKELGFFETRTTHQISSSRWSIDNACLDRDFADFSLYHRFLDELGAKHARLQSGWAKTEKKKGVYDFAWLDAIVEGMRRKKITPWICLCYGNPIYGSDCNLDAPLGELVKNPEGFAAWLKYCETTVTRYRGKVDAWEVWNEPFKQGEAYAKLLIETAALIRRIDPQAKVIATSMLCPDEELVLTRLRDADALGMVDQWAIHPYTLNPDTRRPFYKDGASVDWMRAKLKEFGSKAEVIQGECGCPSELAHGHSMAHYPWTEVSQAKWHARQRLNEVADNLKADVFSAVDLQYKDNLLQSYGLLRATLKGKVVYRRPSFYALRNVFSFFDDTVEPIGRVAHTCAFFSRRAARASCLYGIVSDVNPSDAPRTTVAKFRKEGADVLALWESGEIPDDGVDWSVATVDVPEVTFADPILMDVITGKVYAFESGQVEKIPSGVRLHRLPLRDAPILIAERRHLPLCDK